MRFFFSYRWFKLAFVKDFLTDEIINLGQSFGSKIQYQFIILRAWFVDFFCTFLHSQKTKSFCFIVSGSQKISLTVILLLAVLLSGNVFGNQDEHRLEQDGDSTASLPRVTVMGNLPRADMPFSVSKIESKTLQKKYFGQEPSALFNQTPGFFNQTDSGGLFGYSYLRLRGIDQSRVNFSIDGVPLNEPEDQGVYFSNLEALFFQVQQVYIQRGPGNSENGNAAYAGSVQLQTREMPNDSTFSLSGAVGSFATYSLLANAATPVLRAAVSHSDTAGYKDRSNRSARSVFLQSGLDHNRHSLKAVHITGYQRNNQAWLPVRESILINNFAANANADEKDEFLQSLTYLQYTYALSNNLTALACTYFNFLNGNYDFDLQNFLEQPPNGIENNYALRSYWPGAFTGLHFQNAKLELRGTLHANMYSRRHTGRETPDIQLYENTGLKQEVSGFLSARYTVYDFSVFANLQLRQIEFSYRGDTAFPAQSWLFLNPRFGVSYSGIKNMTAYYSIARTSREPTRTDMFAGEDNLAKRADGSALTGILTAESVTSQELGLKSSMQNWRAALNLFVMDFENEITLNGQFGPNGLPLNSSTDTSRRTGFEFETEVQLPLQFFVNSNLSFNHARVSSGNLDFSPILSPRWLANFGLGWQNANLWVEASAQYRSESFLNFSNSVQLPSALTANVNLSAVWDAIQLSLFVFNVTNERVYSGGNVASDGERRLFVVAPLNILVRATYTWER